VERQRQAVLEPVLGLGQGARPGAEPERLSPLEQQSEPSGFSLPFLGPDK